MTRQVVAKILNEAKMKLFIQLLLMLLVTTNGYAARIRELTVGETHHDAGTVFCIYKDAKDKNNIDKCDTTPGAIGVAGLIMANNDQTGGIAWPKIFRLAKEFLDPQEKHNDWYPAAQDELNKLYIYAKNSNLIGKNCAGSVKDGAQCFEGNNYNNIYWSSTESKDYGGMQFAQAQDFIDGGQYTRGKDCCSYGVRAIRAFDSTKEYPFKRFAAEEELREAEEQKQRLAAKLREEESRQEAMFERAIKKAVEQATSGYCAKIDELIEKEMQLQSNFEEQKKHYELRLAEQKKYHEDEVKQYLAKNDQLVDHVDQYKSNTEQMLGALLSLYEE